MLILMTSGIKACTRAHLYDYLHKITKNTAPSDQCYKSTHSSTSVWLFIEKHRSFWPTFMSVHSQVFFVTQFGRMFSKVMGMMRSDPLCLVRQTLLVCCVRPWWTRSGTSGNWWPAWSHWLPSLLFTCCALWRHFTAATSSMVTSSQTTSSSRDCK